MNRITPRSLNNMNQVTLIVRERDWNQSFALSLNCFISLFCLILIRITQYDDSSYAQFTDEEVRVLEAPLNKFT